MLSGQKKKNNNQLFQRFLPSTSLSRFLLLTETKRNSCSFTFCSSRQVSFSETGPAGRCGPPPQGFSMKTGTAEPPHSRAFLPATIKVHEAALLCADSCDSWMQSAKTRAEAEGNAGQSMFSSSQMSTRADVSNMSSYEKTMMQMYEGKTAAILTRTQKKRYKSADL